MPEAILGVVTNTDQIRSVMGIDNKDLSDAQMDSPRLELELGLGMTESSIDYKAIITEAESTPTEEEKKRMDYLVLYVIYTSALLLTPRLRLAAAQKIGDGDNSMERFLNPKFDDIEAAFLAKSEAYKNLLKSAVSGTQEASPTVSQFSGVAPSYDPVAGS